MPAVGKDHVIRASIFYTAALVLEVAIAAALVGVLFPYTGPEYHLPGLYRYLAFAGMATVVMNIYYIVSKHFLAAAYNCWTWLICEVFMTLCWLSVWIDITVNAASMSSDVGGMADVNLWNQNALPRFAAAAGIGAINAFLAVGCLIYYGRRLHSHRQSGAPYVFLGQWRRPAIPLPSTTPGPYDNLNGSHLALSSRGSSRDIDADIDNANTIPLETVRSVHRQDLNRQNSQNEQHRRVSQHHVPQTQQSQQTQQQTQHGVEELVRRISKPGTPLSPPDPPPAYARDVRYM